MGDTLCFKWKHSEIFKRVVVVFAYNNFKSMLQVQGVRSCLPHLNDGDIEGAVNVYHSFRDYEKLAKKFQNIFLTLKSLIILTLDKKLRIHGLVQLMMNMRKMIGGGN